MELPRTCDYCNCLNNQKHFVVRSKSFPNGEEQKSCKWVQENPLEYCGPHYDGTIENCPLACGLCTDSAPTPLPTSAPSQAPTEEEIVCDIIHCTGETYQFKIDEHICMKVEVNEGGNIFVGKIEDPNENDKCNISGPNVPTSSYESYDVLNNHVVFDRSTQIHGWGAKIQFVENNNVELANLKEFQENFETLFFFAKVEIPHCPSTAPSYTPSTSQSASPSENPTSFPSIKPSMVPSRSPSNHPLMSPSKEPTTLPSSDPITKPTKKSKLHAEYWSKCIPLKESNIFAFKPTINAT